jgi:hypothetical protein
VLSAINDSKNGSKFGRGEPFVWCDGPDVFEASERGRERHRLFRRDQWQHGRGGGLGAHGRLQQRARSGACVRRERRNVESGRRDDRVRRRSGRPIWLFRWSGEQGFYFLPLPLCIGKPRRSLTLVRVSAKCQLALGS